MENGMLHGFCQFVRKRASCKTPVYGKIDDFVVHCKSRLAGSFRSDEDILRREGESERMRGAAKGRFYRAPEFCNWLDKSASFLKSTLVQ